jgi:hypothetical protein
VTEPTAGEITVRNCVVRVIRRGGWSWGPDPRGLVQQALDSLPDLLSAHFDEHVTGDGPDLEITEPVVLTVQLGRSLGGRPSLADIVVEPPAAMLSVLPEATSVEDVAPGSEVDLPAAGDRLAPTVAALFEELSERNELAPLLALLPTESLRRYVTALLANTTQVPSTTVLTEVAEALARHPSHPTPQPATRAALVTLLAASSASASGTEPEPTTPTVPTPPTAAVPTTEQAGSTRTAGETRIASALPFLLAGPLARTGYLDAIGPALAGVDLLAAAPLFAAALAYQVLGNRTADAATFAGLDSVPDLARFADHVRPALPVLDGVLALSLCRGHDPADPLLITGLADGLLLVDAVGMFPIAWSPDAAGLLPHWTACGRPTVLVCDSPLPPATLRDLASAGVPLITDILPLRDDPLTRLPWRTPLWTHGDAERRLAAELPAYADSLAALTRALFARQRPLERSVGLAASLALGMIAWTLWRERETPDPVLALTRFADLEGTVQFRPDVVRVRIPLGRRHTDLSRAGLLTDVPNVVWLAGRTLTFSGG